MTLPLFPFQAAVHVGRTQLGLVALIFVWKWGGSWHHRKLRLA